ncbi:hypothetical protein RB195_015640 [Necator americanus]|uniref:Transposase n=1 Tax=Necator americanus TaxID=51031 RepID=A0ABR1E5H7_NECAM
MGLSHMQFFTTIQRSVLEDTLPYVILLALGENLCLIAIFVKFTSTSSKWAALPLKPLAISTKYGAREVSTYAQYNVGSKSFVPATPAYQDEPHESRPPILDHDLLKATVEADPRKTTRDIAKELNVDHTTVVRHLKQIVMTKKLDKWVPHELTESQKNRRFEISSAHLLRNENDPFLERIVTCDEKWILYDNRRRSAQWLDQKEAPRHHPKPKTHQKKIMVTVWWSAAGMIHYTFLNPGETITAEKYCQQIDEMHQKLRRRGTILLHDNARPHVSD